MNVASGRVKFRDRSTSDVLDLALRFLVVQGHSYAKVALVSLVPCVALSLGAGAWLGWEIAWLVAIPLAVVAQIPFTVLASRLVFEQRVRTRDVLRAAARDAIPVLFVRAVAFIGIVFGAFVLLMPGVWLATIFFFLSEVMLLERGQAFRRSQRIAASAVGDVLVGLFVLTLVPIASVLLFDIAGRSVIGELLQFRPPEPLWSTNGSALATIGLFAQVPYLATARFFLYLNVRTRAEGWDIQTRFAAIAARVRSEAAPASSSSLRVVPPPDNDANDRENAA